MKEQRTMTEDLNTKEGRGAFMDRIMEGGIGQHLTYLWGRWQDERGLEDFATYKAAMGAKINQEARAMGIEIILLKLTQRPFAATLSIPGFKNPVTIISRATNMEWKTVVPVSKVPAS